MGLDIFLYNITKPTLDTDTIYNPNLLDELRISSCNVEDNKAEALVPSYMIDNLTQMVNVTTDYFDNRALFKEFQKAYPDLYPGSPDDYFENAFKAKDNAPRKTRFVFTGSSHASDQVTYTFEDWQNEDTNGETPRIRISANDHDELKDIYMVQEVEPHYVWKSEQVAYQRKGLSSTGWELLPDNCSYCFDKSVVEALIEEGLSEEFLDEWIDGETALVAWW